MSQEAKINGKNYGENSLVNIQISVRNLIIILGFILSTVTGGYFALRSNISEVKDEVKTVKVELKAEIDQIKDEDLKLIYNQVNLVDGKVQVLVSGGGNRNWNGNNDPTPSPTTERPTESPITDLPDME